jgi:hypothetical protein
MAMSTSIEFMCRLSLSFLWLFTAATSFWWGRDIGYEVLAQQQIQGVFADICINAGCLLDAAIGVWLLTRYRLKWCYKIQMAVIISYSILLSLIAPSFWLDPFAPLTKNLPILMLLIVLLQTQKRNT